jgi:hypothetical protein
VNTHKENDCTGSYKIQALLLKIPYIRNELVSCALSNIITLVHVFIEDTDFRFTLKFFRQNIFVPFLNDYIINIDGSWFQQDGSRPHTAGIVLDLLKETFGKRMFSNTFTRVHSGGLKWSSLSPDSTLTFAQLMV